MLLGRIEQVAILQPRRATLVCGGDFVVRQGLTQGFGRALVEKYAHLCGSKGASRSVIKYGSNLLESHAGKPFDELSNEGAVLEILEERGNGHASTAEYPGSADTLRISLDHRARRPVNHGKNGSTFTF